MRLQCLANDPDGDAVLMSYDSMSLVGRQEQAIHYASLTTGGEVWTCTATANDGTARTVPLQR